MAENNKEYKSVKSLLGDGKIMEVFGGKTFITVTPAFPIDKIKFSIIDINSGGKNYVDFYLNILEARSCLCSFDTFCREVLSGIAFKKIAADNGQYPSAYKWVTGKDGCKNLAVGGGQKGIRIQIRDTDKKVNKMAIVQQADLVQMATLYRLLSGLTPVQAGSYYDSLVKIYRKAEEDAARVAKRGYNEESDGDYASVSSAEQDALSSEAALADTGSDVEMPKPVSSVHHYCRCTCTGKWEKRSSPENERSFFVVFEQGGRNFSVCFPGFIPKAFGNKEVTGEFHFEQVKYSDGSHIFYFRGLSYYKTAKKTSTFERAETPDNGLSQKAAFEIDGKKIAVYFPGVIPKVFEKEESAPIELHLEQRFYDNGSNMMQFGGICFTKNVQVAGDRKTVSTPENPASTQVFLKVANMPQNLPVIFTGKVPEAVRDGANIKLRFEQVQYKDGKSYCYYRKTE